MDAGREVGSITLAGNGEERGAASAYRGKKGEREEGGREMLAPSLPFYLWEAKCVFANVCYKLTASEATSGSMRVYRENNHTFSPYNPHPLPSAHISNPFCISVTSYAPFTHFHPSVIIFGYFFFKCPKCHFP